MGSRQWSIWNDVTACKYNSNKSFGFDATGDVKTYVGSSSKNSELLVKTLVTKRQAYLGDKSVIVFRFSVDDVVVKIAIFEDNRGKAGKHISTHSAMENVEGLKLENLTEGIIP